MIALSTGFKIVLIVIIVVKNGGFVQLVVRGQTCSGPHMLLTILLETYELMV